jgi:hypothetical protein
VKIASRMRVEVFQLFGPVILRVLLKLEWRLL